MTDWQVGDRALCIEGGRITKEGRVYTVDVVTPAGESFCGGFNEGPGASLRFVELQPHTYCGSGEERFRKIRPDEQEACEPEFVTLLKRSKRKVSA